MRPAKLDQDLSCMWLHHNDYFLKLGPFKSEIILNKPEIMVLHEFAFSKELSEIISAAKGKLAVTPIFSNSKPESSTARTSKMTYLNDLKKDKLQQITKRIQLLTRFSLMSEKFASENYKIMNYGLGGKVQGHWDSTGNITGKLKMNFPLIDIFPL